MISEKSFSVLAVLAVIAVTLGFFVTIDPEDTQIFSQDTQLSVVGVARQTQPLKIEDLPRQVVLPRASTAYHLSPDGVILDQAARVVYRSSQNQAEDQELLRPYRYHQDLRMWEAVEGVRFESGNSVFEVTQLGTFVFAEVPEITAPIFTDVYSDMRAQAPRNAVGYETAVGFSLPDQEVVRLAHVGEQGGCGGTVRVGDAEELSRSERDLLLDVAGELRTVKFVFVTRWFTSSTGGCSPETPLMPLSEYDILDEIHL